MTGRWLIHAVLVLGLILSQATFGDDLCDVYYRVLFRLQAREKLLSQNDYALVEAGLEVRGGGICGPVCLWNKIRLWHSVMGLPAPGDTLGEVAAMVKGEGRDPRYGMDVVQMARQLQILSGRLPGQYRVEMIGKDLVGVPKDPAIRYGNRDPRLSDLEGPYPQVLLLEARVGNDVVGGHYILYQPTKDRGVGSISDPERPNEIQLVDFTLFPTTEGPLQLFAGRDSPYLGVDLFLVGSVQLVPLKPEGK